VKLYLMRHAEAVPATSELSDSDRYLTARGREMSRIVARLVREEGVAIDAVVTSPLARAVQTAELVADGVDFLGVVEVLPSLGPERHPRHAAEEVVTRGNAILVVGHEPTIGQLGAFLLGRPGFASFRIGQLYALEDGRPTWTARPDAAQVEPFHLA
jgi:phosphohistidine phosphatase